VAFLKGASKEAGLTPPAAGDDMIWAGTTRKGRAPPE